MSLASCQEKGSRSFTLDGGILCHQHQCVRISQLHQEFPAAPAGRQNVPVPVDGHNLFHPGFLRQ